MDATLKAKWVEALRSGEYQQARNSIGEVDLKQLCCLGVGAVVAKPSIELFNTDDAVNELCRHGFTGYEGDEQDTRYSEATQHLISLNDIDEKSFAEIADYIEKNL